MRRNLESSGGMASSAGAKAAGWGGSRIAAMLVVSSDAWVKCMEACRNNGLLALLPFREFFSVRVVFGRLGGLWRMSLVWADVCSVFSSRLLLSPLYCAFPGGPR